jgi:Rab GDP dissociation inhibitor
MPQGFSRVCALSGGVQSLRVGLEELLMDPTSKKVAGLVIKYDGEVMAVKTSRIVASPEYFQAKGPMQSSTKMRSVGKVVRSICILDHPIKGLAAAHKAVQLILPQKQTGRKHDIYITSMGETFKVAPKGHNVAIVSTTVETSKPLAEIQTGISLLGAISERFDKVSDVYVPASGEDGEDTNIFATSSFDATSHFETVVQDLERVYLKITGEKLDLTEDLPGRKGK